MTPPPPTAESGRAGEPAIRWLDPTLPTPAENLAGDEALLADCAEHGAAVLRFWETASPCVVIGYANSVAREVNVAACDAEGVPILRRCTGGGTVVLGPGCLCYSLVLPMSFAPELATVGGSNRFILRRLATALNGLLPEPVTAAGDTDLVWRGRKFSGNAQRRRQSHLLFHGTLLLNFDLALATRYLPMPSREPAYRAARAHSEFLTNLPLTSGQVKGAVKSAWSAEPFHPGWPAETTRRLVEEKYERGTWNRSR